METENPSDLTQPDQSENGVVPFDSLKAMAEAHTELLSREISADSSDDPKFLEDVKELIKRGKQTGALLETVSERRTAQSLLNYWVTVLYRAGQTAVADSILVSYQESEKFDSAKATCPYPGLNPFTEADHDRFFGRLGVTGRVIKRLAEHPIAVLVGPAGGGKTSLVNAGVIPDLKSGKKLPGSEQWRRFAPIGPGQEPLKNLASLVLDPTDTTPAAQSAEVIQSLLDDHNSLGQLLRNKFGEQPGLIVVDRFEEIFTLCKDDGQRDAFIANLLNLAQGTQASPSQYRVIFIIRSDRTHYMFQSETLKDMYAKAEIRIHPLRESDLRETIKAPARKIGLRIEQGVTAQLVREIYGDPAGLPLLQFGLLKLWDTKKGDTITSAAMNEMKSCAFALIQAAAAWYNSLTAAQKETARLVLLKMIRVTDNLEVVGDRVRREDLYLSNQSPENIDFVLQGLVQEGLVRLTKSRMPSVAEKTEAGASSAVSEVSREDQFQLVHESLWRDWETFTIWLKNLREALVLRQQFESLATIWVLLGRKESGLIDKYQVHAARNWMKTPQAAELGYDPNLALLVERSETVIKKERRTKRAYMIGLAVLLVVLFVGLVLFAVNGQRKFREATSQRLAEKAKDIKESHLDVALLLSLEAYQKDKDNVGANRSLLSALAYGRRLRAFLQTTSKPEQIAFSPSGDKLTSLSGAGTVSTWDVKTLQPIRIPSPTPTPTPSESDHMFDILSPDGNHVLEFPRTGNPLLRRIDAPEDSVTLQISTARAAILVPPAFSERGERIAWVGCDSSSNDGETSSSQCKLTLWDVAQRKEVQTTTIEDEADGLLFSPDNRILALLTDDLIVLYQASDLKELGKLIQPGSYFSMVVFSANGKRIATSDETSQITIWNVDDQKKVSASSFVVDEGGQSSSRLTVFALSTTGEKLAAGYRDGTVVFWNVADLTRPYPFPKRQSSEITEIVFYGEDSNAAITVASDAEKEPILLWNHLDQEWEPIELPTGRNDRVNSIALSADALTLAAACSDGAIVLWNLKEEPLGKPVKPALDGEITAQAFTPDRTRLVVRSSTDKVSVFDAISGNWIKDIPIAASGSSSDVIFSNDGRTMAARSENVVTVSDTDGQRSQRVDVGGQPGSAGGVTAMAINGEGAKLATADETQVILWTVSNPSQPLRIPFEKVACLAFNRNGSKVIAGTRAGRITIWNIADGGQVLSIEKDRDGPNSVSSVALTPDDANLVAVAEDGTLYVWDSNGKLLAQSKLNISSAVLSPDGRTLACVRNEGGIVFWDLNSNEGIGPFSLGSNSEVASLAYASNGNILAAGHRDGSILLIDLSMDTLRKRACAIANRNLSPMEISKYRVVEDQGWKRWFKWWRTEESFYTGTCPGQPLHKEFGSG